MLTGPATSGSAHPFGLKVDLRYDIHFGVDRTSGPWGWVDLSSGGALDRSVFLSKAYRYRQLTHKYRGGDTSYIRSLVSEKSLVSVVRQKNGTVGVSTRLIAGKDICERYFILQP